MNRRLFLSLSGAALLTACARPPAYESLALTPGRVMANPGVKANVGASLETLYRAKASRTLWSRNGSWTQDARVLFRAITGSWAQGLQPTSFLPAEFNRRLPDATQANDEALSAAAIKYVSDVKYGRTRSNFDAAAALVARIHGVGGLEVALGDVRPTSGPYRQLAAAAATSLRRGGVTSPGFSSFETTMEKLRWGSFPDISGQVIVVNIAAFDLHAYNNGRPYLRSRVVVGKEGRETPVGRDYISNLKFSPDWTPPASIIRADLVPALAEDPRSLDPLGMDVFVNGRKIEDKASVNWGSVNPSSVRMYQPPGPNGILGGVRFTLNNSRAIYLHDTSAKPLFGDSLRTASSGCVRVEQSLELARWLLDQDGQSRTTEELEALMILDEPEFVRLSNRVRLEMLYYTAWINDQGVFTLYPDIYERDTELVAALARG